MSRICAYVTVAAAAFLLVGCPKDVPKGKTPADLETELSQPNPPLPEKPAGTVEADAAKVHVIDIGQGLAVMVEFPCGVLLYDTGGEENAKYDGVSALTTYLDAFFARRPELGKTIDLLVIGHPHIDHTRGIPEILERYTVKNVIDNGDSNDDLGGKPQIALQEWVKSRDDAVPYYAVKRGAIRDRAGLTNDVIDPIGSCERASTDPKIAALWGGSEQPPEVGHNSNNDSIVLRIDYGESSFLLAGDLEIVGWAKMTKKLGKDNPVYDVDVYVVGHHGSKNATIPYQVELMTPKVALISAGPYSRYLRTEEEFTAHVFAHPNAKALAPLMDDQIGVSMWRDKPIKAWVGLKGRWKQSLAVWEQWVIRRAIYATSWDGSIVATGNANGYLSVEVETAKWVPPLEAPVASN